MSNISTIKHRRCFLLAFLVLLLSAGAVLAQSTAFSYQGRLTDGGAAANGTYDMEFRLFDMPTVGTGTQIGSTITRAAVTVTAGIFTVSLDFGVGAFPGANRFLEISVRLTGSGGSYTTLAPRQGVTATPYAVRSLNAVAADTATTAVNATQLGGVAASQYVKTDDSRLSDSRTPTAGSSNYIQNTSILQASSNFNISGNGTAGGTLSGNVINATTRFDIAGSRVLSVAGSENVFAGVGAGASNTTGFGNSFFGAFAGNLNTEGFNNAFFGRGAGTRNTLGGGNSFFGREAGALNTEGNSNSFFGRSAGAANTTGDDNAFFGYGAGQVNTASNNAFFGRSAGFVNTTGDRNAFLGRDSGSSNTTGTSNTFVGIGAGNANTTGAHNTVIGADADVSTSNLDFATSIGAGATVSNSNSVVLGRSADTVRIPGSLVITGSISKGSGSFTIDDPLDPENKTLSHSFVESPDMMNIYNGNAILDRRGRAVVTLPAYFQALNREFRYQLTSIGAPAPDLHIAQEIQGNCFRIAGGKPGTKVSWQVTGIRHDPYAEAHRIRVEAQKPPAERGTYLHPDVYRKLSGRPGAVARP